MGEIRMSGMLGRWGAFVALLVICAPKMAGAATLTYPSASTYNCYPADCVTKQGLNFGFSGDGGVHAPDLYNGGSAPPTSISVPKFDTTLGLLTKVTFDVYVNYLVSSVSLTAGAAGGRYTAFSQGMVAVWDAGATVPFQDQTGALATGQADIRVANNTLFAPNETKSYSNLTQTSTTSTEVTTGLSNYQAVGGGTITLPVNAYVNTLVSGPSMTNVTTAFANAGVRVTYTYDTWQAPLAKVFSKRGVPVWDDRDAATSVNRTANLVLTLGNATGSSGTLAQALTDTLPSGLIIAPDASGANITPASTTGTCDKTRLSFGFGSPNTVTYASGAPVPNGGCTIIVPVTSRTGSSSGTSYLNTISADSYKLTVGGTTYSYGVPVSDTIKAYTGSLSGRVWKDAAGSVNGAYDSGTDDPLLQVGGNNGVYVDLYQKVGGTWSGSAIATQTSSYVSGASGGNYSFDNLPPGTYRLVERTQPDSTSHEVTQVGTLTSQGTSSAGSTATSPEAVTDIVLGYDSTNGYVASSAGNNFVEVAGSTAPSLSKSFSPTAIPVSGGASETTSTLTITLSNSNASAATLNGADFYDTLPNHVFFPSGASVSVVSSPTGYCSGTVTATNISSTQGEVRITGGAGFQLPPNGTCTLTVPVKSDVGSATGVTYTNSIPGGRLVTDKGTYNTTKTADLTVYAGVVSGRVWKDVGVSNGTYESGTDVALGGVSMKLYQWNGSAYAAYGSTTLTLNPLTPDATTGTFSFTNLPPGRYKVEETDQPTGTADGITTRGTVGGTGMGSATAQNTLPSAVSAIDLAFNAGTPAMDSSINNNFAEIVPVGASLSGRVYHDINDNQQYDPNAGNSTTGRDVGLGNITITLTPSGGGACPGSGCTTVTAADGTYGFVGLVPGTYAVTESKPSTLDWFTTANALPGATGGGASSIPGNPGAATEISITGITLTSGLVSADNDFRLKASSLVNGVVFLDNGTGTGGAFNDGVQNGSEPGIPNVTVTLNGSAGGMCADGVSTTCQVTTDSNGKFSFSGLRAGTYSLVETQPSSYNDGKETAGTGCGTAGCGTVDNSGFGSSAQYNTISAIGLGLAAQASGYKYAEIPVATLSGYVWLNKSAGNKLYDPSNVIPMQGWTVKLTPVGGGTTITAGPTDSNGAYSASVTPGTTYQLEFINPSTGRSWPGPTVVQSNCGSCNADADKISGLTAPTSGGAVNNLNLPIDPSGIVYDSTTGLPISGATVTIAAPGLKASDLANNSLTYTTGADGGYQFFFLGTAPAGVTYTLSVTAPNYLPVTPSSASTVIPVCSTGLTVYAGGTYPDPSNIQNATWSASRLSLPRQTSCPTDNSTFVTGAATTMYYLAFAVPVVWSNVINNHIPMDSIGQRIIMTKKTPLLNVARGDLVPYSITALNNSSAVLTGVTISDQIPPGFKYRTGSATLDGAKAEPGVTGRMLAWPGQTFTANQMKTLKMLLVVGSGVGDGSYTNSVWAEQSSRVVSNVATATVKIVPDATLDCPDVIGKVFNDLNANGYQDQGEPGIPGVRLATPRGLLVTTDAEGRFHVPCPEVPNPDRGSNFFMKLDDRTLPSGFRLTTENPRDVRLTRGKLVKLNFGATIHQVVRIELTDAAFVPGKTDLLPGFQAKIEPLPRQLTDKPSLIRLAYPPGGDAELRTKRLDALREQIGKHWQDLNCCYRLVVETEGEGE